MAVVIYLIFVALMFAIWFGVAAHSRRHGKLYASWPLIWVISIFAGLLWPLTLAWMVIYTVAQKYG